jgi:TonB family protein
MFLKSTVFRVSFLLASSTGLMGQAAPAALPQDPLALMTLAHERNGLTGSDVRPWHMHATYHAYDAKGKLEYEGTYEEWWVSPSRYKLNFSNPKFSQTDYGTGTALVRDGSQEWPAGPEFQLRASLIDPLLEPPMLKEFKLQSRPTNFGKVRLQCVAMTYPVRPNVQVTGDFYPAACFEPGIPALRIYSDVPYRTVFDRMVQFQGHYLAREVQISLNGKVVADMSVDVIETLKDQPDSVITPPSSALPVDLTKITFKAATRNRWPMLVKKAVPFYPDEAKSRRIEGTVNLTAAIGPDGHIEDPQIIDGPVMLRQAAVDAVRQWLYRPFEVLGEPRRVQIELHVIFSLG